MTPPTSRFRFLKPAVVATLALLALPAWAEIQTNQIETSQWSGQRALDVIVQLLKFTPRSMETVGHQQTIDYIMAELAKTKFKTVKTQRWVGRAGVEVLPVDRWSAYAPEVLRWRLDGSDRLRTLHELSQVRSAIEPLAARLAAAQAGAEQRATLVKAVLGMVEHSDRADEPVYLQHDVDFHAAVLRGSCNPYLAALADVVAALLHARTAHALMPKRADETALRLHQDVAAAIPARDPEAPATAMAAIVAEADHAVEAMATSED